VARISLHGHWKFLRLVRAIAALEPCQLTGAKPVARGILELLWEAGYNAVSDYVGTPADIADAVDWRGDPAVLVAFLVDAGFLDERAGRYVIHDLWDNAPRFAQLRHDRKRAPVSDIPSDSKSDGKSDGKSDIASDYKSDIASDLPSPNVRRTYPGKGIEQRKSNDAGASFSPTKTETPDARKLVPLGYELVRLGQRFATDADVKAAIKELAARYDMPYDASSVSAALDMLKHAKAPLWDVVAIAPGQRP